MYILEANAAVLRSLNFIRLSSEINVHPELEYF